MLAAVFGLLLIANSASADTVKRPVVLELFTSNSCEQCPPADEFMSELQRSPPPGIDLILLSEHVDYWNPYGWIDRYSSAQFTDRQQMYGWDNFQGKVYTPQLIINGTTSTVGTWKQEIRTAIETLSGQADRPIALDWAPAGDGSLDVAVGFQGHPADSGTEIWVALVQNSVVSKIGAGENAHRTLHEDGLVRTLIQAHSNPAGAAGRQPYRASLVLPFGVARADLAVIAFAQRPDDHAIIGARRRMLADTASVGR